MATPAHAGSTTVCGFVVRDQILARYLAGSESGGALGCPMAQQEPDGRGGAWQNFNNINPNGGFALNSGYIFFNAAVQGTDAHSVTGGNNFAREWDSFGRENGPLGYPVNEQSADGRHGSWQAFEHGFLFGNPRLSGANPHAVYGAFAQEWTTQGRENGALGYPLNEQSGAARGGVWQAFEGGFLFSNPGVAGGRPYAVSGSFSERWTALSRENGPLGYPTSNQSADTRGGSVQAFERGYLLHPNYGGYRAHAVYGQIANAWLATGREKGSLGYPISDVQTCSNQAEYVLFENGMLNWLPGSGVHATPADPCG